MCDCHISIMSTCHPSSSPEHDLVLQPNVSRFPCPLSMDRECQGQGLEQILFLSPLALHLNLQTLGGAGYSLVAARSQFCVPREQHLLCWGKNTYSHCNHRFPCPLREGLEESSSSLCPCALQFPPDPWLKRGKMVMHKTGGQCPPGGSVKCNLN